jgi:signal transduction histidine kinase/DNA-binding NarL/FixJ family response regulator
MGDVMSTGRILVVEDDPDTSNMLRIYFQSQGYEVTVAAFGKDALEMCRQQLPHIIVLDIMLPDIDGYDVCRELRGNLRTSHIPIIFLTQRDERPDKIHGLELGADDYITKPFDVEELKLRVRNVMTRAQYESLTNPTTGLSSGRLIEDQLRQLMRRDDWDVIYVGINGFNTFGEVYGFVAGEEVLRFAAMVLEKAVDSVGTPNDFIGHIGGDDFVIATEKGRGVFIMEELQRRFDAGVGAHYDWSTRQQGYLTLRDAAGNEAKAGLMSFSIGLVAADDGPFVDIREIIEMAADSRATAQRERAMLTDELHRLVVRRNQLRERIEIHQEGHQLVQLLEETAKLAARVTHDLRSELGIIKDTAGLMLQELAEDDPAREHLKRISISYEYCEMLLQDLLELGFNKKTQPQLVDLDDAIQNAISLLRNKISPDIRLEVPSVSAEVYGDRNQLQQVFTNLVRRAVASSGDGQLAIAVEPVVGDYVAIRVVSSIFRVAHDQQDRVFDLDFMLGERGCYNVDLFVANKILTRHNAAIKAISKQEAGTELSILLPLYSPEDWWLTVNELQARVGDVEAEVKALEEKLEAFERERLDTLLPLSQVNRLVSGLARSLLNELWVIKNSVELMLQDGGWQDLEEEDLIRIDTSCQYCELLVRNLLEIGLEKKGDTPQIVDVTLILREVVRLLEGKMAPEVEVRWELDEAMPGLLGNEWQLKQVFMNLVRNALDAMPERGILTICTRMLNSHVQIQVVDTGCGISDENLEKVFSLPFTTKREGYGIGLHIVKSIVTKHGGEVKVKSQVGKGTIFTVRLPIRL